MASTATEIPFSHHSARSNCLACQLKRDREKELREKNPFVLKQRGSKSESKSPAWRSASSRSQSKSDSELPTRRRLHQTHSQQQQHDSDPRYAAIPSRIDTGLVRGPFGRMVLRTTTSNGSLKSPDAAALLTPPMSPPAKRSVPSRRVVAKERETSPAGFVRSTKPGKAPVPPAALLNPPSTSSTVSKTATSSQKRMGIKLSKSKTVSVSAGDEEERGGVGRKVLRGGGGAVLKDSKDAVAPAAEPSGEDNDADDEGDNEEEGDGRMEEEGSLVVIGREANVGEAFVKVEGAVKEVVEEEVVVVEEVDGGSTKQDDVEEEVKDKSMPPTANEPLCGEAPTETQAEPAIVKEQESAVESKEPEHLAVVVNETPEAPVQPLDAIPEDGIVPTTHAPTLVTQTTPTGAHIVTGKTFTILDESGNPVPVTIPAVVQLDAGGFSDTTSMVSHDYDSDVGAPHRSRVGVNMMRTGSAESPSSPPSLTPVNPIRRVKRRQIDMSDLTGLATLATSRLNDLRATHPALRTSTAASSPNHSLTKSYLSAAKEISLLGKGISTAWLPVARACTDRRLRERLLSSLTACETAAGRMKVLIKLKSGDGANVDGEGVLLTCAGEVVKSAQEAVRDLEAARVLLETAAAAGGGEGGAGPVVGGKGVVVVSDEEGDGVMVDREPGEGGMEAAVRAAILAGGSVASTVYK
ncbi:hypothetical protein HDU67_004878 [Dinochytrium kinnereticum]|nr:hypothetical protein HDU67_004878 [Dinochytrium kinnereticum]